MIRLFVGLDLPYDAKRRLDAICYGVDGAQWSEMDNLHLTLRFIGEVNRPDAETIAEALERVHEPAFELTIAGIGHFGTGPRVRTLWAGVEPAPALTRLRQQVSSVLSRLPIPRDPGEFKPHVTLARFDRGEAGNMGKFLEANGMLRLQPFLVDRFVLFSSIWHRDGPVYRVEAEYPLYGADWADEYERA